MKTLNLIALILITSTLLFAAAEKAPVATTSISGQIIDKETGEALAGVKIEIDETIVYSDLDGNFEIENIVPGKYEINSSLISYTSSNIKVDCNTSNNKLAIELEDK